MHACEQLSAFTLRVLSEEGFNSVDCIFFRNDGDICRGTDCLLKEGPYVLDPPEVRGSRWPDEGCPKLHVVVFGVICEVGLGADGYVGAGIILLPMPGFGAENFFDRGEKLVFKNFSVNITIDVAVHNERTNEAVPGYSTIHVYG